MNRQTTDSYYPIDLSILPASWYRGYVGDIIFDIHPGFASGSHNQEGIGVPHLRPMNIDREGRLDLTVIKYVSGDNPLRLHRGDVLLNNTNSPELVGKTTSINQAGDWAYSNHMTRLRPPAGVSSKFIGYQLHFLWMSGYFRHRCTHHVNQASIPSMTLAKSVPLALASTNEQERIVAEIEKQYTRLDAAVAAMKRIRANLKRYRGSVLKAACEGRLVPIEAELARTEGRDYEPADQLLSRILKERRAKWEIDQLANMKASGKVPKDDKWKTKYQEPAAPDTSTLPNLPEGWVWTTWNQVGISQNGRFFPSSEYQQHGVKLLRPGNLYVNAKVVWTEENTRCLPENWASEYPSFLVGPRQLVMNLTAQSLKDEFLGRVCMTGPDERCLLNQRLTRLTPLGGLLEYYLWMFKSEAFRRFVDGLNKGSLIQHMFTSQLAVFILPLPPAAEQSRIVLELECRLSAMEELDFAVHADLRRAERLRQAILTCAFEGKLVPQDPKDEPASALLERIRTERARLNQAGGKAKGNPRTRIRRATVARQSP